jgi:predicted esterase
VRIRSAGPHQGQPVLTAGAALGKGAGAMVLLHGRGASAEDILELAAAFERPAITYLAPQAEGSTWYPQRFLAPLAANEPWLSSALAAIGDVLAQAKEAGISPTGVFLGGFSQGACLSLEFAVRHPAAYAGLVGLSGGLIGPPGTVWPDAGSLAGVPVFLGCSDVDAHIPAARVRETADVFRARGAIVTEQLYPGMGHTVNADEIRRVQQMLGGNKE